MSETQQSNQIADWSISDLNEADKRNLLGFLELLLKVDRRVNPQLYANNKADNAD